MLSSLELEHGNCWIESKFFIAILVGMKKMLNSK
jgi:hypothetical protein